MRPRSSTSAATRRGPTASARCTRRPCGSRDRRDGGRLGTHGLLPPRQASADAGAGGGGPRAPDAARLRRPADRQGTRSALPRPARARGAPAPRRARCQAPTGVREVQLSPELADVLVLYRDERRRDGRPVGSDDFLWSSPGGGPGSYTWALKKGHRAAIATERRAARGLPAAAERDAAHAAPHLHLDPAARDRQRDLRHGAGRTR
jgi:hypothetical protein